LAANRITIMRRTTILIVAIALYAALPCGAAETPKAPAGMSTRDVVKATRNGIVRIEMASIVEETVTEGTGKDAKPVKRDCAFSGSGTGFIIPGGYIVTNHHVITTELESNQKLKKHLGIRGTFAFDTREPASTLASTRSPNGPSPFSVRPTAGELSRYTVELYVVNSDELSDLAVLRVKPIAGDTDGSRRDYIESMMDRSALQFAPASDTEVGDDVVAIGFPRSLEGPPTVTKGIISATNRSHGNSTYCDLLQTDAPINPGNSGGPLIDMNGRVVGVNTYSLNHNGTPGIGFARSSRTAEPFVRMLQKKTGVTRQHILSDAQEVLVGQAERFGITQGLIVTKGILGGATEKAGLMKGDLIVSIGSERVTRVGDYFNALALNSEASTVIVVVWRLPAGVGERILASRSEYYEQTKYLSALRMVRPVKEDEIRKVTLTIKMK